MTKIKSRGTRPERVVMLLIRSLRYRCRAHAADLPGTPDFVLSRRELAIFVHGCFWHAHSCRRGRSMPTTRRAFWVAKKAANVARDRRAKAALRKLGYRVLVIWECELQDPSAVKAKIRAAARRCAH